MTKLFPNFNWRLSLLLTILSFSLWGICLVQLSNSGLVLSDIGIAKGLPAIFWISIASLSLSSALLWSAEQEHKFLLSVQIVLFIGMFWLTPVIAGDTPVGTRDVFSLQTLTRYILVNGHLDPATNWYHNWPGFNLISTSLQQVGGIKNSEGFFIWATAPLVFLLTIPAYNFFKSTIRTRNYQWAALWSLVLFNWTGETYFAPQGFAFFLFLTFLGFLAGSCLGKPVNSFESRVTGILLVFALTITHLLTALVSLFILILVSIFKNRSLIFLSVIFTVLIAVWMLYFASHILGQQLPALAGRILRLDILWNSNVTSNIVGSPGHIEMTKIRVWYSLALGILASIGFFLSWKYKNRQDSLLICMGAGVALVLPLSFYEKEFFPRLFLFELPVLAYFGCRLFSIRIAVPILILFLMAMLPFGIISLHGNQIWANLSVSERAYYNYLDNYEVGGYKPFNGWPIIWFLEPGHTDFIEVEISNNPGWQQISAYWSWYGETPPHHVGITTGERTMLRLFANSPLVVDQLLDWLKRSNTYDLTYNNGAANGFSE